MEWRRIDKRRRYSSGPSLANDVCDVSLFQISRFFITNDASLIVLVMLSQSNDNLLGD
jgi:hypothetical protein